MKKYIFIVLLCSVIDFLAHGITSSIAPFRSAGGPSIISKCIGDMGAAALWIVLAFSLVALWYYIYEKNITTTKINKGLLLGLAVGILWLLGMIESATMSTETTFIAEGVMGLCDAVPLFLLVVLLNKFTKSRESILRIVRNHEDKYEVYSRNILSIIIFAVIFVIMRYIFYFTNLIASGYVIKNIETLVWTVCMGVYFGVFYLILKQGIKGKSLIIRAGNFGFIAIGIPWFIFLYFMPMLFEGAMLDVTLRCLCDGFSAFLGYYICGILFQEKLA